jgi:hypothetical protein
MFTRCVGVPESHRYEVASPRVLGGGAPDDVPVRALAHDRREALEVMAGTLCP